MAIPKVIHYCWFGGNEKSPIIKKCIKSWKKYCPDYKIIEWNESNFDVNSLLFCKQAYEAKKWAFVTDYVRLKVISEYGGIYMDTDVELLKSLNPLLHHHCFMGFQHEHYVNNGLILGAEAKNWFVCANAHIYESEVFDPQHPIICQEYTTNLLQKYGLVIPDTGKPQDINGVIIYPSEYFCPLDIRTNEMHLTQNTYAIHHFASSWWDDERKKKHRQAIRQNQIHNIVHIPNRLLMKILGKKHYKSLKDKLKGSK